MARETGIGEPIPKGVIDTAHGSVGVEEQMAMSPLKQLKQLRAEVAALRRQLRDLGYDVDVTRPPTARAWAPLLVGMAAATGAIALLLARRYSRLSNYRYGIFANALLGEWTLRNNSGPR